MEVPISDAHLWTEICNLTRSRQLFTSTAVVQPDFFLIRPVFSGATLHALPSDISTMFFFIWYLPNLENCRRPFNPKRYQMMITGPNFSKLSTRLEIMCVIYGK